MSRKTGTLTINDKVITVNELLYGQILELKAGFRTKPVGEVIQDMLPLILDVSHDFLLGLAPSELKQIYEKAKEVNSDFLELVPLVEMLAGYRELILQTITSNLSALAASSLQQVMEPRPMDTAGDIS